MFSLSLWLLCAAVYCLRAFIKQVMYMQALQGNSSSCRVFQLLRRTSFVWLSLALSSSISDQTCWLTQALKALSLSLSLFCCRSLFSTTVDVAPYVTGFVPWECFLCRRPNSIPISCYQNLNLDGLLVKMWEMMALVWLPQTVKFLVTGWLPYSLSEVLSQITLTLFSCAWKAAVWQTHRLLLQVRVYTKKVGAKPDFGDPVILSSDRGGTLLEHLCRQIHNSMVAQLNYALVWGTSSKHYPQRWASLSQT